jgi:antitoxin component YwqK of YwqJK toxin-antitoxin module
LFAQSAFDTTYFVNGKIDEILTKDGSGHIIAKKRFYESGELLSTGRIKNNQVDGKHLDYYKSGKIMDEFNYNEGVSDGKQQGWFESGEFKSRGLCRNDSCIDTVYYISGEIEKITQADEGKLYYLERRCKDGKIIEQFTIDGSPHSCSFFYCNGKLSEKGTILYENTFIGKYEQFYEDGGLMASGQYLDKTKGGGFGSTPVGSWSFYNEQGNLIQVDVYDDEGKLVKSTKF